MEHGERQRRIRNSGPLPRGYHQVLDDLRTCYQEDRGQFPELSNCVSQCQDAGIDPALAETCLLGLLAVKLWYAENRQRYENAKRFTEGNSKYADRNQGFRNTRRDLSKIARRDRECRIILGFMNACGVNRVSKRLTDPMAVCLQQVLDMPDYISRRKLKLRKKFEEDGDPIDEGDETVLEVECEKYRNTQVCENLRDRVKKYLNAASSPRDAMEESRKVFEATHSSGTSVP